jgi:hypothetical protein
MRQILSAAIGLSIALVILTPGSAHAWGNDVHVRGHHRSDGSYVQPHYRSAPDGNRFNNWSTQGNVNPYTGQIGTRDPHSTLSSPIYGGGSHGSGSPSRTPRCSGFTC